jgi:error-prone DNA polymerase
MPPTPPYIELHTASAFSFLDGASTPEALVARAAELGYPACALLDRDNLSGIPRFHLAAKAAGVRAIVGAELTIRAGGGDASLWKSPHPPRLWRLPVLVESAAGYRALCRLITQMKCGAAKGEGALSLDDLEGETSGLVALVGRAALDTAHYGVGGLIDRTVGVFGGGNVYVELQRHHRRDDLADGQALMALASAYRVPVVATNGVKFAAADERPLFDVLTCVRHGTSLARAGARLAPNAERILKAPAAMAELFRDVPHAVAASRALADRLAYSMTDLGYRFPSYPVPAGETQASFLRKITEVGGCERYRPFHDRARHQIARELDLIERLDLAGYFLIVWDIVNFARQHGILVQGRGSAANSAVCYSLGITAVDPVGMELLFERFLSEERGEWPDIDLDLPSGDRREEVIQYVYRRYGEHGAAMTANVITYRSRSAAREVGKALDLDATFVDRLSKVLSPFEWRDPKESLTRRLRDVGLDPEDGRIRLFADLWTRVQHLPRHLGQHSGGMVMCAGRLDEVVPLEPATMPGRVVMQWDKEDCADMGIVKVDLLGLGMMAVLQDALTIINTEARAAGIETLDLAKLPPDDPTVYRMLQEADTMGIFQVESPRADGDAPAPQAAPLLRHRRRGRADPSRADRGADGASVHQAAQRARSGDVRASVARAGPQADARRAALPGAVAADGHGGRWLHGGRGRGIAAQAMGFKRSEERMQQIETKLRAGMARKRHHQRRGRIDREVDRVVCALRVPGVARGELRAHRLRERVLEGALSGRVLHGAAQQPAHGVLPSGDAREGCAAARRALHAHRCAALVVGLPCR